MDNSVYWLRPKVDSLSEISIANFSINDATRAETSGVLSSLPEVRTGAELQAVRDEAAAPVVDVYDMRASSPSDGRNHLPQVVYFAASVVLRDVSDDKHPMWHLRETA